MRESLDAQKTARSGGIACKHRELQCRESTIENRGVPDSSPGLATAKWLQLAIFLESSVRAGVLGHEAESRGLNGPHFEGASA